MINTNLLEILTNKPSINILSSDYNGNWELLSELREKYKNYNFYKWHDWENDDSKIYCWARNQNASKLIPEGFTHQSISNQTHPPVWSKIIEDAFINLFIEHNREISRRKYSYIWKMTLDRTKSGGFYGDGIECRPYLNFSFHFFKSQESSKANYFIGIRKKYEPKLTFSEKEYRDRRIDNRNWMREDGRIIPSTPNVKKLLQSTGQDWKYSQFRNQAYSSQSEYAELTRFLNNFNLIKNRIYLPDELKVTDIQLNNLPNLHTKHETISKPIHYFYNETTGGGFYNDRVKKLKPTSYDSFRNKSLDILFLAPKDYEGNVGSFSTKLIRFYV